MPVYYGRKFVLPLLIDLVRQHSTLQLDLRFSDKFADLVTENLDLAIRIGTLTDSTLVARRIDKQSLVLCASARYLEKRGTPRRIEDLAGHDAVAFRLPSTGRQRPWQLRQNGTPVELSPHARVFISDTESLVAGIMTDIGICQLPDNLVLDELASGEIVEVLPSCRPAEMPISVVYQSGRLLPARVRVAIDALDVLRQRTNAGSANRR
jgi:DNA-binding transcriptional LysR family regulator